MRFKVNPCFSREEAHVAAAMLELIIDALIELHVKMCRTYEIYPTDDLPF